MSDEGFNWGEASTSSTPSTTPLSDAQTAMQRAAAEVMRIEDVTYGERENPIRLRGELLVPAEEAFARLRPRFEAVGHTPMLRHEDHTDEIRALPTVFHKPEPRFPTVVVVLLVLTILSVFLVGVQQYDQLYALPYEVVLVRLLGYERFVQFYQNTLGMIGWPSMLIEHPDLTPTDQAWRAALWTGVQYMLAMLGILGTHEMGHYLVARYYKVHTTPPFFIPMPLSILGTMGAVIAMREPAPNRRIQFDIGVAGPLAGLIIAIPVLFLGLQLSEVRSRAEILAEMPPELREMSSFMQEGNSLAYLGAKYLVFGEILPQGERDVWIHPIAFAAWAGLLVTALNLLPIGQLDGGHVMYGLFGRRAQAARRPVIVALFVLAILGTLRDTAALGQLPLPGWSGWWIWILFAFFLLRSHAPVLDEITGLDGKRKALGVATLIIFILIFTPTPLVISPAESVLNLLRWLV